MGEVVGMRENWKREGWYQSAKFTLNGIGKVMIWEFDIEESLIIYKPLFLCNQKEPNLDGGGGIQ